jgi:uncharacterized protein (DUF433 family)
MMYYMMYNTMCYQYETKKGREMASRYPLNLPLDLKRKAEQIAKQQGVSLNQFILWSVSEKVAEYKSALDDPRFPYVAYRRGASGIPMPVVRGTGIRVQTIAIAHHKWGESGDIIAKEYGLSQAAVADALAFFDAHRSEIELHIRLEEELEKQHDQTEAAS